MWIGTVALLGCSGNEADTDPAAPPTDAADTDTDTDADTDTDTDTDRDADTDTDSECAGPTDCDAAYGAPPCGTWSCTAGTCEVVCPGCTDADLDGFGPDAACAAPDCDDSDPTVHDQVPVGPCFTGDPATRNTGACTDGTQSCTAGVWTPCQGQILPGGEACNDEDDDCNGVVDDGLGTVSCGIGACTTTVVACDPGGVLGTCVPAAAQPPDNDCDGVDDDCDGAVDEHCIASCVWVTPTGDDGTADGSAALPYATIQAAINAADPGMGEFVCVAEGPSCGQPVVWTEPVVMRDGVHVYGSYETTGNTRCGDRATMIEPGVPEGVFFGASVSSTTILDGFEILRGDFPTSTGVTVEGSGVVLSDVLIDDNAGASVQYSTGVWIRTGGEATVTQSDIVGGNGSVRSIGIHAEDARASIVDNCESLDANGYCDDYCRSSWNYTRSSLQGARQGASGGASAYGIYLDNAPGSRVEQSAVCSHLSQDGANVYITGNAAGTVIRKNNLSGWGGSRNSHGVWMVDCAGASPLIVDNWRIIGESSDPAALVDAIRAEGDCHPTVDGNRDLAGGGEGGAMEAVGVYCGSHGGVASRCTVLNNALVRGSAFGWPPVAAGVMCVDGGCNRIAGNTIVGNSGVAVYGVWMERSGAVVEDNDITGGCGSAGGPFATVETVGLFALDAYTRIANNRIRAGSCASVGAAAAPVNTGMKVVASDSVRSVDVHSNVIDGQGDPGACASIGLELGADATAPPTMGRGVYRNNIVRAGVCGTAVNVWESDAAADPAVFEHNDLDPTSGPVALYQDEDSTPLTTPAAVDGLADTVASGTMSADPMFVAYPTDLHVLPGSPVEGAGTPVGAPRLDMDGDARDAATPDIGADEL